MIKIIYDPDNGFTTPDNKVDNCVKNWIKYYQNRYVTIIVGNEIMIDRWRLAILNKEIDINEIEFWFEGNKLTHTHYGVIKSVDGFCDIGVALCQDLIMGGINLRKIERKLRDNPNDTLV